MTDHLVHVVEEIVEKVEEFVIDLFKHHPHYPHFHLGKPRPTSFRILAKGKQHMTTNVTYLNAASTNEIVQLVDQYGFDFTTDASGNAFAGVVTATPDNSAIAGSTIGAFGTNGQAALTLTQGTPGDTNVTIASAGLTSLVLPIISYVPVASGFRILPSTTTPNPAPASASAASTAAAPATAA